jgi:hypothetical protein
MKIIRTGHYRSEHGELVHTLLGSGALGNPTAYQRWNWTDHAEAERLEREYRHNLAAKFAFYRNHKKRGQ